jgi:hypothetical protein
MMIAVAAVPLSDAAGTILRAGVRTGTLQVANSSRSALLTILIYVVAILLVPVVWPLKEVAGG